MRLPWRPRIAWGLVLALVAAEEVLAHRARALGRRRAAVLDGEVGEAAPRIGPARARGLAG